MVGLSTAFMAAGKFLKSEPFVLDGMAVQRHSQPVVAALVEGADHSPTLAKWLDGMGQIGGPWAMIGMAVAPLVAQLAVNHRMLKPGMFETVDLSAELDQAVAADQAAAEAGDLFGAGPVTHAIPDQA
jgi:hypothetical protein